MRNSSVRGNVLTWHGSLFQIDMVLGILKYIFTIIGLRNIFPKFYSNKAGYGEIAKRQVYILFMCPGFDPWYFRVPLVSPLKNMRSVLGEAL